MGRGPLGAPFLFPPERVDISSLSNYIPSMETFSLGPLEEALAFQVLRTARLLRHDLALTLLEGTDGLTVVQFFLLYRLAGAGTLTQRELVDPDLGDKANITRQLGLLEDKGLVRRQVRPEDKRSLDVALLPEGRALLDRLIPRIVQGRTRLFGDLGEEDEASFRSILRRLRERCQS